MATSLIPSGQTSFPIGGNKAMSVLNCVVSTTSDTAPGSPTWSLTTPTLDSVNNTIAQTLAAGDIAIVSCTTSNACGNISVPKPVKQVGNYVIATNSHSIHKGNNLTQLLGNVGVGNGVKGLESKVVEDAEKFIFDYDYTTADGIQYYDINTRILEVGLSSGVIGKIYVLKSIFSGTILATVHDLSSSSPTWWSIDPIPTHSTMDLDNSNSPAIKTLSTIATADDGELLYQVFGEEVKWDFANDTFAEATSIAETETSYVANTLYEITGTGQLAGKYLVCKTAYTNELTSAKLQGEKIYSSTGADLSAYFELWDGNGFGDNNKFNQLTNGTRTDLNGNTIKTIVATIGTGIYK